VNQKVIQEVKGSQGIQGIQGQNKDNKDDSATLFIKLQDTIINNSNFEPILLKYKSSAFVRNIDDLFFAQTQMNNKNGNDKEKGKDKDETLITLNISLLSYLLIKLMTNILYITLYDDLEIDPSKLDSVTLKLTTVQKQNQRISCHIVYYIIDDFIKYIAINDTDNDKIKKRVEELREKRKQEMIAEYSSDAEKRKMQMLLKKMGLKIDDPDDLNKDEEKDNNQTQNLTIQNLSAYDNEQQENENYNINYQGDNADGDEIEEDYFVNQETEFE
jgi:hypothetical protein